MIKGVELPAGLQVFVFYKPRIILPFNLFMSTLSAEVPGILQPYPGTGKGRTKHRAETKKSLLIRAEVVKFIGDGWIPPV